MGVVLWEGGKDDFPDFSFAWHASSGFADDGFARAEPTTSETSLKAPGTNCREPPEQFASLSRQTQLKAHPEIMGWLRVGPGRRLLIAVSEAVEVRQFGFLYECKSSLRVFCVVVSRFARS